MAARPAPPPVRWPPHGAAGPGWGRMACTPGRRLGSRLIGPAAAVWAPRCVVRADSSPSPEFPGGVSVGLAEADSIGFYLANVRAISRRWCVDGCSATAAASEIPVRGPCAEACK